MKSSNELRTLFLDFFARHDHRIVESHSLIPPADPTLLFVNAGMVQFKDIFIGNRSVDYKRATSSQKCLRVSGKHNDLENVGRTARHHTFFEMLGNFSFADYFKKDAIRYAYEFLVDVVGLDPDRCYFTVFGGDGDDELGPDEEAIQWWAETAGIPPEKVLLFGKKDNFWSMGETGPCGPCSEILYDRGPGPWGCGRDDCKPGCDCDRFVEIWNLVFMQYERLEAGGKLTPLPAPSIDTGMGLERLAAIVQEQPGNYETDVFMPLIKATQTILEEVTGLTVPYGSGGEIDVAYRVIADHARAAAFMVADGVYPDNEGRGYITRLLIRRAVRFGRKLGFTQPFLMGVCAVVVDEMGEAYPELKERLKVIRTVVTREEETFVQTFDEAARALELELQRLRLEGVNEVGGEFLFWLHDERGLQPDLAELIASEQEFTVDRTGYEELMEAKKNSSTAKVNRAPDGLDDISRQVLAEVGESHFVGYECEQEQAVIQALVTNGARGEILVTGETGQLVLDRTPFYAEAGGQVGDQGVLQWEGGEASVLGASKSANGLHTHEVRMERGELRVGQSVVATVAGGRKAGIRAHHSATHLLHWALNEVLGDHIKQEGSLVKEDLLRFDFRHFAPLTAEEIQQIEFGIAGKVLENSPVETLVMPLEQAVQSGAKAFFDDKYSEDVRVVTMGDGVSRELCGGNHVKRTGEVGMIKITRQEAVSSGIRRIYAVCHKSYVDFAAVRESRLQRLVNLLRTTPDEVSNRVQRLLDQNKALAEENHSLEQKLLSGVSKSAGKMRREFSVGTFNGVAEFLGDADKKRLRTAGDTFRNDYDIVFVAGSSKGKTEFVIARTGSVADSDFHSGRVAGALAGDYNLRGGGKAVFAQAGGPEVENPEALLDAFVELAKGGKPRDNA